MTRLAGTLIAAAALVISGCSSSAGPSSRGYMPEQPPRPEAAESYSAFLVARFATLTNDPRTALDRYQSAMDASGPHHEIAERAVFAALLAGGFDAAETMARKADSSDPSPLVRLTLAVAEINEGRPDKARKRLEGSRFGPFNRMMAVNLQAWCALETDGPDAARDILLAGRVNHDLLDSVTLYMLGMIDIAAGEDARALDTFETVWANGPRLAVASEAHAQLLAATGQRRRAAEILRTFRQEIGANPSLENLRRQIESGAPVEIRRLNLRQGAGMAIYAPAAALAAQTDGDLAGIYFSMALALNPELDIARTLWADTLDEAGRRSDALAVLHDVGPRSPFYATARGQMAWALRREGRNEEALRTASEALAHAPDRDLSVQLGDLFTSLDRDGEAETIFTGIISGDEENGRPDWRLYLARGAARERLGRWPEAEADLMRARQLSPDNPQILNHLGYGWVDRGQNLDEAMRLISRAVDLDPHNGLIIDSLGWAHFRLGHYQPAVLHLERAVELEPGDPVINDHLGDAYWHVGRRLEAHYQWKRALSLDPRETQAETLRRKLRDGLPDTAHYANHAAGDMADQAVQP